MLKEKDFYYRKSRLTQLRGFCAVVQSDFCISDASKKINIETSALSKQVSSLERDLGIKLLDRTNHRRLKLTKEGELFYKKAVYYTNGLDGLFEEFNEHLKDYNNNHLDIALHKGIATSIFPSILEKMLKVDKFKNLEINIYSIPKDEAIKKLINKEIDLAFYIQDSRDRLPIELDTIKSIRSRAYLVFNKLHPLAKKEIITKNDIENYKIIKRNTETKSYNNIYSHLNIQTSNVKIFGSSSSEIALEIVKKNSIMVAAVSEVFLSNISLQDKLDVEIRDIEHLVDEAFFHIVKYKNSSLTEPMSYLINEFKKLKDS